MKPADIVSLNQLANLRVTLLFTYSGTDDKRIEPYPSQVAADSLKLMSAPTSRRYSAQRVPSASPGEPASAQLKTWRILRKLRCCPW